MKPNYQLKASVLQSGCVSDVKDMNKRRYYYSLYESKGDFDALLKVVAIDRKNINLGLYTDAEIKEAQRVISASYQRTRRLKDKIQLYLMFFDSTFLTLTFTNKTLSNTTPETRRRYVARYLKQYGCDYVANIDYGKKGGREHYHAVLCSQSINYTDWHKFGAIKGEKIEINGFDVGDNHKRLAKYISKLSNHAIKETAKGNRMLYSRNGKAKII